jgi:dihydroorotate dehydrogenase (NAD+) catalytic subunit
MSSPDLSVQLAPGHPQGLLLRNPVMVASGTFGRDGYGAGLPPGLDFQGLGAVVAKTTTLHPRPGNPTPRIVHGQGWTLNSIGIQNPGIKAVLTEQAPRWASWRMPVILSLAAERLEEFGALAAMADGVPGIAALELNVSCPNVAGGLEFGQSPQLTHDVARLVREATGLPVIVKLSPNVTDIVAMARAAAQGGAHALTLTNTLAGMALDPKARAPILGATFGGVSGPALKPVALAMVYRVYQAVEVPIIGVGGIASAQDALEYLLAGARAVQIGTANFANPRAPLEVLAGLQRSLARQQVSSLADLVGAAHRAGGVQATTSHTSEPSGG